MELSKWKNDSFLSISIELAFVYHKYLLSTYDVPRSLLISVCKTVTERDTLSPLTDFIIY